ncbi:hypothetical protein ACHAXR_009900, partial [Thalassiosira sp. AJA248-18]
LKKKQLRRTDDDNDDTTNKDGGGNGAVKTAEAIVSSASVKVEDDNRPTSTNTIPNHNSSDGGDDKGEDEPSAINTILAVERRRKLLGTGQRNRRGVDAANLGKHTLKRKIAVASSTAKDELENAESSARNKDLEERLKGTFAGGKLAGSNDMGGDNEGGILEKKHRKAMEEFIQENIAAQEGGGGESKSSVNNKSSESSSEGENKYNASEAEKEMYAELLPTDNAMGEGGTAAAGEGDVGAGGAMMGGTGIAEVALPIDNRIKALKETEKAAMEYERARKARFGMGNDREMMPGSGDNNEMMNAAAASTGEETANNASSLASMVPMNFASGPGKRKRQDDIELVQAEDQSSQKSAKSQTAPNIGVEYGESSALPSYSASSAGSSVQRSDVSTLGASYSHNFQLHTKEWVSRRRDERQTEIDAIQAQQEAEEGPPESRARMGFEMSRKLAKGEAVAPVPHPAAGGVSGGKGSGGGGGRGPTSGSTKNEWDRKQGGGQHSSDDRVWKTFMSKQRNRR